MTSNVGAELIKRQTALGFGAIADHGAYEAMRDKILDESKRIFEPEFLNRLDDMIVFHQLERNDLAKIVDIEVAKVIERVRGKGIKVQLDRGAIEFLINKGFDPIYGARRDAPRCGEIPGGSTGRGIFAREHQAGRHAGGPRRW
jgi:ATP-dependent Clp protease ATP-binding subunit ClpC